MTLALAARGKLPWNKVLPYWGAQVLGAFVAALILYFVYQGAIVNALGGAAVNSTNISQVGGVFYTSPKPFVGIFGACWRVAHQTTGLLNRRKRALDRLVTPAFTQQRGSSALVSQKPISVFIPFAPDDTGSTAFG